MLAQITVDLSRFDWQGVSAITDLLMVMLNIILIISVVVGYKSLRQSVLSRDVITKGDADVFLDSLFI